MNKERKHSFSEQELLNFKNNGFAGPFKLYEKEEMDAIWKKLRYTILDRSKAVYEMDNAVSSINNIGNYDRHLDVEFLKEHVAKAEIVDKLADVLGNDIICWRSEWFPKYPGDPGTEWHQADTFANTGGVPLLKWPQNAEYGGTITVWTAFKDTTIDTACLKFIPGTQEEMFYDETLVMEYDPENTETEGFFGYNYKTLQKDPNWIPDESKAVSVEMKAGEFIIFWSTLMHASNSHKGLTDDFRLGFVSRYVPDSVNVYEGLTELNEFGGTISLKNFKTVVVSGKGSNKINVY